MSVPASSRSKYYQYLPVDADQYTHLYSLGNSGLKISKVILGAMSYGSSKWQEWVLDEDQTLPLLEYAYKRGINTWDTVRINPL